MSMDAKTDNAISDSDAFAATWDEPQKSALSQAELDWSAVTVTLADERCLPPTHPDSNAHLVQQHLLRGRAQSVHWLPLFDPAQPSPEADPSTREPVA